MNNVNYNKFNHDIDYKFSQGASLSIETGMGDG